MPPLHQGYSAGRDSNGDQWPSLSRAAQAGRRYNTSFSSAIALLHSCSVGNANLYRETKTVRILQYAVFNECRVLFGTKDDAYRRVITRHFAEVFEHPNIHVHLANVLVSQLSDLEIDKNLAFQQVIVEHQIDEVGFRVRL
jgi:hypothetical protein